MLTSLYVLLYLVSLGEISAFVNSRKDKLCIKSYWKDRFLVAVDSDEKIIRTIAFTENKDVDWKGVPIEGETFEINSVLGKFFNVNSHMLWFHMWHLIRGYIKKLLKF